MKFKKQDYLGEVKIIFVEILVLFLYVLICLLKVGILNNEFVFFCGMFIICVEKVVIEVNGVKVVFEEVELILYCSGLENMEMFFKSDSILRILKWQLDGIFIFVYQIEEI